MDKDVKNLLARVQRSGAQVVSERGEIKVYNEGRLVTTISKSQPHRGWRDRALRELAAGGVLLGHARRRRYGAPPAPRGTPQGPLAPAPYVGKALPLLPLPPGPVPGARRPREDGMPLARQLRYYAGQLVKLADEIEREERRVAEIRAVFNGVLELSGSSRQ